VATTTTKLMTFAEFEQLPDAREGFPYELRHGELVKLVFPKMKHFFIQQRLRRLLENAAGDTGIAATELGFRALAEYEYRRADVAFVSKDRWESCEPNDYFRGAPEIVIEVLSPSNTVTEMLDKEKLCLENGCKEFWIVDPDLRLVKVSTPDGRTITYRSGQEIPLPLLNGACLAVDSIFAPAEG
jgi:Uma2 family endonuclease